MVDYTELEKTTASLIADFGKNMTLNKPTRTMNITTGSQSEIANNSTVKGIIIPRTTKVAKELREQIMPGTKKSLFFFAISATDINGVAVSPDIGDYLTTDKQHVIIAKETVEPSFGNPIVHKLGCALVEHS